MQNGSLIRKLPPEIHNKIAAGEVVQRPGSVVKELLDNSIDAGASHIKVIVENAGRTLIQVTDNGSGMVKDDLPLCFERHATSKIQSVDDLFNIHSLGFRGEAMASIAAVAQVNLKSKSSVADVAYEYEIWGGEERVFQPCAFEQGTSISVKNLFFNVPARRAFLKTDATEFRHIITTLQQATLANPDIAFDLIADGSEVYKLPQQSKEERIVALFGKSYKASLIPVSERTTYISISGYLIDPKLTKRNRGEQFLFVNGRPFSHRYLSYVVSEVYKPLINIGEHPFYALFIEIDPKEVDVNVHPTKMEVKFEDEKSIVSFARSVVKKALNERFAAIIETPAEYKADDFTTDLSYFSAPEVNVTRTESKEGYSVHIPSRINHRTGNESAFGDLLFKPDTSTEQSNVIEASSQSQFLKPDYHKDRGFWQLHDQFVVSQTRTGMCLVDQHLAHRRIVFERSLNNIQSGLPGTQQLLFPQQIDFSASDFQLMQELMPTLTGLGFSIQTLSGYAAIISGVPSEVRVGEEKEVLLDLIHDFNDLRGERSLNPQEKAALALAKRTAIPRGKKLSQIEMEKLVDELFACDQPMLDPQGKPTLRYISLDEIRLRFK